VRQPPGPPRGRPRRGCLRLVLTRDATTRSRPAGRRPVRPHTSRQPDSSAHLAPRRHGNVYPGSPIRRTAFGRAKLPLSPPSFSPPARSPPQPHNTRPAPKARQEPRPPKTAKYLNSTTHSPHSFVSIRVHSCPFVSIRGSKQHPISVHSWFKTALTFRQPHLGRAKLGW
jgi:hypothetical protein